jgi:transcriptional regulator with XRE-family HTH domain
MDSTLLSKIELGQRLPTDKQTCALAAFFGIPAEELQARCIADKFWNEHRNTPAARRAASMIASRVAVTKQQKDRSSL